MYCQDMCGAFCVKDWLLHIMWQTYWFVRYYVLFSKDYAMYCCCYVLYFRICDVMLLTWWATINVSWQLPIIGKTLQNTGPCVKTYSDIHLPWCPYSTVGLDMRENMSISTVYHAMCNTLDGGFLWSLLGQWPPNPNAKKQSDCILNECN